MEYILDELNRLEMALLVSKFEERSTEVRQFEEALPPKINAK